MLAVVICIAGFAAYWIGAGFGYWQAIEKYDKEHDRNRILKDEIRRLESWRR